jgi:hypothetical protein
MMCMECACDYLQQMSTADDTLDFCSAKCELSHKTASECEIGALAVDAQRCACWRVTPISSKYPPAEPGALDCEPLKAAVRGR